jgi:hypothetical protein
MENIFSINRNDLADICYVISPAEIYPPFTRLWWAGGLWLGSEPGAKATGEFLFSRRRHGDESYILKQQPSSS